MVNKINNKVYDVLKEISPEKSDRLRPADTNKADASLQISSALLVEKAAQEPIEDVDKVERARLLLLSGELDRPENIHRAAENILKFGI